MTDTDSILDLAKMAAAHQQDDIITAIHARLLSYWPEWHHQTVASFKAHMARLRAPPARRGQPRLTPVSLAEIQHGYTYLASYQGNTTGLFKLFTAYTKPENIKGYEHFFRIDVE